MPQYDSIVIGLGTMGAAACYHLAGRGQRVLGLEQFQLGHDRGSSHGETRLIRKAYFEDPSYVPLLVRAYELWDRLAYESGENIFLKNGLVIYGKPGFSKAHDGALSSGRLYGIPVEELSREEALQRWPEYVPPPGFSAVFEPGAGFLRAEPSVLAHAKEARKKGAILNEGEPVVSYSVENGQVRVRTDKAEYTARKLVIAGGGWSSQLLRDLGLPLKLRRMLLGWFGASAAHQALPGFIFDMDHDFYYGFPQIDGKTIKIADHRYYQELSRPEEKDEVPFSESRIEGLRDCIRSCLPQVSTKLEKAAHCIYTMTPDENFVIDSHPLHPQISFAAGFSGHGFKFSSVVGEILADLAIEGRTKHPIAFLSVSRFLGAQ